MWKCKAIPEILTDVDASGLLTAGMNFCTAELDHKVN